MGSLFAILSGVRAAKRFGGAVIFGLIGLALLAGAVFARLQVSRAEANFVSTQGDVVAMVRGTGRSSGSTAPEVRFIARDGRSYTVRGTVYSNPPAHKVGDRVDVQYDPANPADARINDFLNTWFLPLLLGGLGCLFGLIGVAMLGSAVVAAMRAAAFSSAS